MKARFQDDAGILAIDLAKTGFQVCAIASEGEAPCNRKVTRPKLEKFLEGHSPYLAAMEACSTSHHRGRVALAAGHEFRLVAPNYASRSSSA